MPNESPAHPSELRHGTTHGVRLLVADPDLGSHLDSDELEQAREQAVFPAIELAAGPLELDQLRHAAGVRDRLHGFLVIDGSLTINLRMSGRTCTRLIGARELVLLDGVESDSLPAEWEWSVLTPARLALLDGRLHTIARRWPLLLSTIIQRAAHQTRNAFLQQAISQLPRVEERLLALFWSVADRQGVVRPDGVWVDLSATHDTLAHMVGAQRPTVSLGLARLAESGLLRAEARGWLIARDSLKAFESPNADMFAGSLVPPNGTPSDES
jgi:CRP/FNR family transcriptional regulator, cyclic AMP receptor protein